MLRLLITNDDGIRAQGLLALVRRLVGRAKVTVVAPDGPRSACGHSITLHKPLRLTAVQLANDISPEDCLAYECSGTPADCITLAVQHLCQSELPHAVLSGINEGSNVAEDLIYSGTVAGATEAAVHGLLGIAISLQGNSRLSFDDAAVITEVLLSQLLFAGQAPWLAVASGRLDGNSNAPGTWSMPPAPVLAGRASYPAPAPDSVLGPACYNVNIPDVFLSELGSVRWTRLGHRRYEEVVVEETDPRGRKLYWLWGKRVMPPQSGASDIRALDEAAVSVTPIKADLFDDENFSLRSAQSDATSPARVES